MKLSVMSKIIIRIPVRESMNKKSAIVSNRFSLLLFFVRMEKNEKKQERVSIRATTEVNSSMRLDSILVLKCNEVITKRQNPKRFAEVFRMCCEVLLSLIH